MRRSSLIAVLSLLLVAFAGGGIAFAHDGGSGSNRGHGGSHQVELRVRASKAEQGGSMRIRAQAHHLDHGTPVTAQAVVHFVSGDVTVDLAGHGHSRNVKARVPVLADETLGPVTVDVSITIDGVVQPLVTITTQVVASDDGPNHH